MIGLANSLVISLAAWAMLLALLPFGVVIGLFSISALAIFIWSIGAPLVDEHERLIKSNVIDLAKYRRRKAA